ncbi:cell division protein FtsQ/DivIB [Pseudoalteromonas xiamenensis]|uniref:Cell division protein FtsQ n=1 Tax=Pseudoalteromonas xiamenensis TaxID=882626 RepID=A0A975HNV5_9GAMM|nr:cell division protein FtsQ/DivIB [Pseudoalteromonas xiamenensis]QTH72610.1 cell division protein FtsQ/DivIB [Pseudoalteromonas xiamenensis]
MRAFLGKVYRGAKRQNWSLIGGVSFFLCVVIGIGQLFFGVSDWLVTHKDAQIKQLAVLGKPKYTNENEILKAIRKVDLSSYFELDVKQVQREVQALPWVATASVRKQWPNTLQVYVVEHTPVAIWNSDLLLNQAGEVFQANSDKLPPHLPQLYGPEGSEQEAWEVFGQLKALLAVNQFKLESLALSERFAWQLWLDNGIRLNLGRTEKAKRVQRFIDVFPHLEKPEGAQIDVVDLRYDTGLAVSWKYPDKEQSQNKSAA